MKKNNRSFWILPVLAILLAACTTTKAEKVGEASDKVQHSQDDLDKANENYTKEAAVYRTSVESDLRENKLEIVKIQAQKTNAKNEVLTARNEKIGAMRKRNDELELRIRHYRGNNKESWKEFRHEFDNDMSELEQSIKDFGKDTMK